MLEKVRAYCGAGVNGAWQAGVDNIMKKGCLLSEDCDVKNDTAFLL